MAVELLVAGGRVAEAREHLDEYKQAPRPRQDSLRREEQIAFLEAIVAAADNRMYEVIRHLEPIADRAGLRPVIRSLLAEAYRRTGQTGRVIKTLSEPGAERTLNPKLRKLLAHSCLVRGDWAQAREVLRPLEGTRDEDAEGKVLRLAAELGLASEQSLPPQRALAAVADELTRLRDSHPDQVEVRLLLATIAERRDGREAAEAELRRAVEECAEPLGARLALAALVGRDRPVEAAEILRRLPEQRRAGGSVAGAERLPARPGEDRGSPRGVAAGAE